MVYINEDIWRYIKKFLIYEKEKYNKIILKRKRFEKMKIAFSLSIYEELINNKSNVKIVILSKRRKELNKSEYEDIFELCNIILKVRTKKLINQLYFLISKNNKLLNYDMIRKYKYLVIGNFYNYNSKDIIKKLKKKNINIDCNKFLERANNLFLEYNNK